MPAPSEPSLAVAEPRVPSARSAAPRILLFTDDPDRGGVAHYNHALLLGLRGQGYRTFCVQPKSHSPLIAAQRAAGVEHHWLPYDTIGPQFARTLTDMATPAALYDRIQPDLIVFSDCCPVSNLAARHAALARRIPFIVVVGFVAEHLVEDAKGFLGVIAQHYALARQVIAVSEHNLGLLRSLFGLAPGRGTVVHYGRPSLFFERPDATGRRRRRAELGIPESAVVGLTAARLEPIKGYLHQIAAIERLASDSPNYFVWIGEGSQRVALEREIKRRRWQKRIILAGQQWNMAEWYDLADLYLLPSQNEGMPLSIMEAMAKSLPVIASAVSGIPEQLGGTGQLIADPKTHRAEAIREMAETIQLWTADPALRLQVGAAGQERAEQLFREELMVDRTLKIIHQTAPLAPGRPEAA